ncbi:MAG: helix-turn-helix domain-containing protein [Christensenellales bacterium]
MENLESIIAQNLVLLRKKSGLKQTDVASRLKYSDKTISKWETGEVVPSVANLYALCNLYGVTLDQIVKPLNNDAEVSLQKDYGKRNKLVISLLAITLVWILATVIYVYESILFSNNAWMLFVWSVPISCILALIFNSLWGKTKLNYLIISILVWTLIASFYLQFIQYNIFPLFFVGIPAQISIILWSGIKRKK